MRIVQDPLAERAGLALYQPMSCGVRGPGPGGVMTVRRRKPSPESAEEVGRERPPKRDPVIARLDALRAENDRLGIDGRDSVEILRELREQYAR